MPLLKGFNRRRHGNGNGNGNCFDTTSTSIVPTSPSTSYAPSPHEMVTKDVLLETVASLNEKVERLEYQLIELEHDRDAQRELKQAFKTQAIRLGDALRNCRQAALDASRSKDSVPAGRDAIQPTGSARLELLQRKAEENLWYIQVSEVELHEELGRGTSATTYRGVWHGLDVAVKCIQPQYDDVVDIDGFCQELEVLSNMRHPYVLHLLGATLDPPDHAWIVTEYLPWTLSDWLHGHKKRHSTRHKPLPPLALRLRVALDLALGMQYLNEQNPKIIHRDLKPSNIFLDENYHARIADFGFSRYLKESDKCLTGEIGTYIYMAPEVMRHDPYTQACDVYSFGIILCELITGDPPFIEVSAGPMQIAIAVAYNNLRPALPDEEEYPEIVNLITSAWNTDPLKRPMFKEIVPNIKSLLADLPP